MQQGDAIRNITGTIGEVTATNITQQNNYTGAFYTTSVIPNAIGEGGTYPRGHIKSSFDASRVVPTAVENRPVNMTVRYLIRSRP